LRTCWINTYLGPPDLITHNARKNFASNKFKQYTLVIEVGTKKVLVKAYNSISIVKRYHGLIQRVYQIIVSKIPELNKDIALQIAFKVINNSADPNGLVFTLLVFRAYLRMVKSDAPSSIVAQKAIAIKKAMAEIYKLQAKR
jgi:hypothetical protein